MRVKHLLSSIQIKQLLPFILIILTLGLLVLVSFVPAANRTAFSHSSTNFPSQNPLQSASGGSVDAFVTKMSADGTMLLYSTYLGGSGSDWGNGIAVDSAGDAYITGSTSSTNFPIHNALQAANAEGHLHVFALATSSISALSSAINNQGVSHDRQGHSASVSDVVNQRNPMVFLMGIPADAAETAAWTPRWRVSWSVSHRESAPAITSLKECSR